MSRGAHDDRVGVVGLAHGQVGPGLHRGVGLVGVSDARGVRDGDGVVDERAGKHAAIHPNHQGQDTGGRRILVAQAQTTTPPDSEQMPAG